VAVLNGTLAAVLLIGAILNLYYLLGEQKRLGILAGDTVAFAICVGLITKAKPSEVFAAYAAYAAVLVVFISGDLGSAGAG
jgi:drug/metabolite transporter superfamily protein YnfA